MSGYNVLGSLCLKLLAWLLRTLFSIFDKLFFAGRYTPELLAVCISGGFSSPLAAG